MFAILCVGGSIGGGNMFQANQAFAAVKTVFPSLSNFGPLFGIVLAIIVGIVIRVRLREKLGLYARVEVRKCVRRLQAPPRS